MVQDRKLRYSLYSIQYSVARVVTYRHSHALPSSTALLKQLHWLLVEWRIWFKTATMTFKALHTGRSLTNYSTISRPGLCSALIGFSPTFKAMAYITCLSDLALSASQRQIFGIHCLPIFVKPSHFLLSDVLSNALHSVSLFHPQATCPPTHPDSF